MGGEKLDIFWGSIWLRHAKCQKCQVVKMTWIFQNWHYLPQKNVKKWCMNVISTSKHHFFIILSTKQQDCCQKCQLLKKIGLTFLGVWSYSAMKNVKNVRFLVFCNDILWCYILLRHEKCQICHFDGAKSNFFEEWHFSASAQIPSWKMSKMSSFSPPARLGQGSF